MTESFDPRAFMASVAWTVASTMPENPHEYLVERDFRGDVDRHAAFRELVALVRSGERRTFLGSATARSRSASTRSGSPGAAAAGTS